MALTYYNEESLSKLKLTELRVMARTDNLPKRSSYKRKSELIQALVTFRIQKIQKYNVDINSTNKFWYNINGKEKEDSSYEWTTDGWATDSDNDINIIDTNQGVDIPKTNSKYLDIHVDSYERVIVGLNLKGKFGAVWDTTYDGLKKNIGGWYVPDESHWLVIYKIAHRLRNGHDPYPSPRPLKYLASEIIATKLPKTIVSSLCPSVIVNMAYKYA